MQLLAKMAAATKPATDTPAGKPAFSYAQAAKGKPIISTGDELSQDALKGADSKDSNSTVRGSDTSNSAVEKLSTTSTEDTGPTTNGDINNDRTSTDATSSSTPAPRSSHTGSRSQSRNTRSMKASSDQEDGNDSTVSKDESGPTNGVASSELAWDKQSETSNAGDKATQTSDDSKQTQEGSWADETPAEKEKELKAAPVPSVNIWQQRMESFKAKSSVQKPAASTKTNDHSSAGNLPRGNADSLRSDFKNKVGTSGPTVGAKSGSAPQNGSRVTEGARSRDETSKRSGAPPNRSVDKVSSHAPPPVGDAISWPTPDTAQDEEKKKVNEKVDKSDKTDKPTGKAHGSQKWISLPHVPNPIFNTPLPPAAARKGGRSARGGRESTGRGGHAHSPSVGGERSASQAAVQPLSPKLGATEGRGRETISRAASIPSQNRRATSADGGPAQVSNRGPPLNRFKNEARMARQGEGDARVPGASVPVAAEMVTETVPKPRRESRTFSKGVEAMQNGMPLGLRTSEPSTRRPSIPSESQAHPRSAGPDRRESSVKSYDFQRDLNSFVSPRDRSDGRPERGRGGYRGTRGGPHSGYQFANGQSPYASYAPSKSHSYSDRSGQNGPYGTPPHQRGHRNGPRGQSIASPAGYGQFPNGFAPNSQQMPPMQADMAGMYNYPPMHPGMMGAGAMPYGPYIEQTSVVNMLIMQL